MGENTGDVVVIGAGLVGICSALYLQRSGRQVTLVERAQPGDGASGHNAGIFSLGNCLPTATPGVLRATPRMMLDPLSPLAIRWSYLPRLAPWLLRFALASRAAKVERSSVAIKSLLDLAVSAYQPLLSPAIHMPATGHLLAFQSAQALSGARADLEVRSRRAVAFTVLDGAGVGALDPILHGRFHAGVYFPDAPYVEDPHRFTTALADTFLAGGGTLRRAEVTGFEIRADRVRSVFTDSGPIPAPNLVIAAGAWSHRLTRRLGLRVPLETERGYGVHLPNPELALRLPFISADHHFALTPAGGGGLRLAGTDELAGLSAPPNYARAERLIEAAQTIFPELRVDGAKRWMNFRPSTPDSLPVIGRAPDQSNVYLAFGHGHIGLTLAAVTGKLVQELMDGTPASVDLTPFRVTRFGWGTGRHGRAARRS